MLSVSLSLAFRSHGLISIGLSNIREDSGKVSYVTYQVNDLYNQQ